MPQRPSRIALAAAFSLCLTILPNSTLAGAWTQHKGSGQLILNTLHYTTTERWRNDGLNVPQARYSKTELNPYVEYGVTDWLTLGGSTFIDYLDDSTDTNAGLGDTELFARTRLWQGKRSVFSLQPMVKLPSPMSHPNKTPALGSRSADVGVSAISGTAFPLFGQMHFAEAEAGYRYRFGQQKNQYIFSATLGLRLSDDLMVMPQLFQTIRAEDEVVIGNAFTQSPRDDYDLTKAQLSIVYQLDDVNSIQIGGFKHIAGRNTGAGGGALLSYWRNF